MFAFFLSSSFFTFFFFFSDRPSLAEDQARVAIYAILQLAIGATLASCHFLSEEPGLGAAPSMWFAAGSCLLGIVWIALVVILHSYKPPRSGFHIDEVRIPEGLHSFSLLALTLTGLGSMVLAVLHIISAFDARNQAGSCAHTAVWIFSLSKVLFLIVLGLFVGRFIAPGRILRRSGLNTIMLSHAVCTLIVVLFADYVNETTSFKNVLDSNTTAYSDVTVANNCSSPHYAEVVRTSLPYLLPCYTQYALFAAVLLIEIWTRSGRFSFSENASTPVTSQRDLTNSEESSPLLWSLTTHGTFRSPTSSRFFKMSVAGMAVTALLASVLLVASMVLLALLAAHEGSSTSKRLTDNLLYYPYRMLLLVAMGCVAVMGLRTLKGAKPILGSLNPHEILLMAGLCAETILSGFSIAAWSMSANGSGDVRDNDGNSAYPIPTALVVTENCIRLTQAFLQVRYKHCNFALLCLSLTFFSGPIFLFPPSTFFSGPIFLFPPSILFFFRWPFCLFFLSFLRKFTDLCFSLSLFLSLHHPVSLF